MQRSSFWSFPASGDRFYGLSKVHISETYWVRSPCMPSVFLSPSQSLSTYQGEMPPTRQRDPRPWRLQEDCPSPVVDSHLFDSWRWSPVFQGLYPYQKPYGVFYHLCRRALFSLCLPLWNTPHIGWTYGYRHPQCLSCGRDNKSGFPDTYSEQSHVAYKMHPLIFDLSRPKDFQIPCQASPDQQQLHAPSVHLLPWWSYNDQKHPRYRPHPCRFHRH